MITSRTVPEAENKDFTAPGGAGRFILVLCALAAALVCFFAVSLNTGSVGIDVRDIIGMLSKAAYYAVVNIFTLGGRADELRALINSSAESQIIFSIRLPRLLLAAVLGGALSVSGYLLQVFFRNPIAGPFVLGISSGAKMLVGVTLIFLSGYLGVVSPATLIFAAFIGSLIITSVVLVFSQRVRSMSVLLVVGIMVGYLCGAVTDICVTFANEHDVVNLTNWSMGAFSGASWANVKTALAVCIPGVAASLLISKPISVYALGEGYASSMGVRIKPFRACLILLSSVLSACVTAIAGPVSFVGVAVPHITRSLLRSSKPVFVIPASFLCGAVFCVVCDLLARTLFSPTELAIGTVTSVFGAPVVIYMLIKRRRAQEGGNG